MWLCRLRVARGFGTVSGREGWCYVCVSCEWIMYVDGRSRYLYIVLGGYMRILGAPIVQSCCTIPYIYLWHISQIQTCLCVVVGPEFVSTSPAFMRSSASIQWVCMTGLPENCKSGPLDVCGRFRHNLNSSL